MARPMLSWDQVREAVGRIAIERGEWAGMPLPVEGTRMIIHPSYPFHDKFAEVFGAKTQEPEPVLEDCEFRNTWRSYRDGKEISIIRDGKKYLFVHGSRQNSGTMLLATVGAARAWDVDAEVRAMGTLQRHVTRWAFECYLMTGMFLETSPRSKVVYLFRRLRPTVALTGNPDRLDRDRGIRILCTLCAHPIGYYDGSWAGALVPTDDVISHLLLMRADEHRYWRMCNQHPAWAPESGL